MRISQKVCRPNLGTFLSEAKFTQVVFVSKRLTNKIWPFLTLRSEGMLLNANLSVDYSTAGTIPGSDIDTFDLSMLRVYNWQLKIDFC